MRRVAPYRHAIPVLFLLGLLTVVVHTHVVDDDRYGFAMFSDIHEYRIEYRWVLEDGGTRRHIPFHLRGMAQSIQHSVAPDHRETILGRGFPPAMILEYLPWAWENARKPEGAVRIEAELEIHAVDRAWETEVLSYPEAP